jgi:hypothetical protein
MFCDRFIDLTVKPNWGKFGMFQIGATAKIGRSLIQVIGTPGRSWATFKELVLASW